MKPNQVVQNSILNICPRLAEGHAKLMYRTEVQIMDAIFATQLINLTNGIAGNENNRFPEDSMATYKAEGKLIIQIALVFVTFSK